MKLISYISDGALKAGAMVNDSEAVDVSAAGDVAKIMSDAGARQQAAQLVATGAKMAVAGLTLAAPLVPGKIIAIGRNYIEHAKETGSNIPSKPIVFAKMPNTLSNPNDTVTWYADSTQKMDYEAELAVVIGKKCYRVAEADALSYVGGYSCANDLSAREIQNGDDAKQWILGKGFDGSCPFGPALVTSDEIPDPQVLDIKCYVNGQVMQNSNTKHMIFSVAHMVAHLSKTMTLNPGDIICSGTPDGVALGRNPAPWLKDGDEVVVEIEKIGQLKNYCRVL